MPTSSEEIPTDPPTYPPRGLAVQTPRPSARRRIHQVPDGALEVVRIGRPGAARTIGIFRAGDAKLLDFLVGQVMKRSKGRADPPLGNAALKALLS